MKDRDRVLINFRIAPDIRDGVRDLAWAAGRKSLSKYVCELLTERVAEARRAAPQRAVTDRFQPEASLGA